MTQNVQLYFLTRSTLLDVICNGTSGCVSTGEVWISNVGTILRDRAIRRRIQKQATNSKSKRKQKHKQMILI